MTISSTYPPVVDTDTHKRELLCTIEIHVERNDHIILVRAGFHEVERDVRFVTPLSLTEIGGRRIRWMEPKRGEAIVTAEPISTIGEACRVLKKWAEEQITAALTSQQGELMTGPAQPQCSPPARSHNPFAVSDGGVIDPDAVELRHLPMEALTTRLRTDPQSVIW